MEHHGEKEEKMTPNLIKSFIVPKGKFLSVEWHVPFRALWKSLFFLLSFFIVVAPLVRAQTPPCGDTITTDVTFDKDLNCPGVTGTILTVEANDIIIDGAGH